jgi:hypothetical protein
LREAAVETLKQSGIHLNEEVLALNAEKLIWYHHGMAKEYRPKWFKDSY